MKNWMKIGIVASLVLILAVSVSGCTSSSPTATPAPTATAAPTTTLPVKTATATPKPTAKPTAAPTAKPVDTSIDSNVKSVVSYMEGVGYTVTTPLAYKSTTANGDKVYSVMLEKGAYTYDTTLIKSSDSKADYNRLVSEAQAKGFSGSETYQAGYDPYWQGTSYSGGMKMAGIGVMDSGGISWIVQMIVS